MLKAFSLVSKSWAAQSQKHIFSTVTFSRDQDIESWRNAFPDPANTLAHHARTLIIDNPKEFPADLFSSFCNVTSLSLHVRPTEASPISFTRLHGFAPYLKSLEMKFSFLRPSDILNLVYSFPRLDYLSLAGLSITPEAKATPSKPLNFSGSLGLIMLRGIGLMTDHLSSLPGGVHFRKLALTWNNDRDSSSAMALITACAPTLENLHLRDYTSDVSARHSVDLSPATNLQSVSFECWKSEYSPDWIAAAVESINSPSIKSVALHMPWDFKTQKIVGQVPDSVRAQWLALDKVFVEYLTARSLKLKVIAAPVTDRETLEVCVKQLLPNLSEKGMVEMPRVAETS